MRSWLCLLRTLAKKWEENLCHCAGYIPHGLLESPDAVLEAYTMVERFFGTDLDRFPNEMAAAYRGSAHANNKPINTGSYVHNYAVKVAPICISSARPFP